MMSVRNVCRLLIASSALALVANSGAAFAQEISEDPTADVAEDEDVGEIVVTATLRSENLQAVPIAVSAVSGESLARAGVVDMRSLTTVAPSFSIGNNNSESAGTSIRIRGIGTNSSLSGFESAVGVFLDGVYQSRPGVAMGDLLDLDQIEVMRGPQGTTFGRNTSAGAVHIKTKKPDLNYLEGFANASYGNFNMKNIQAGVSAPLIEGKLAARLSATWRKRDGVMTDADGDKANNRDRYMVRGQLFWEPSPDVNLRLIGDYSKTNEECCDGVVIRESSWVAAGIYTAAGLPANGGVAVSGPEAIRKRISPNNGSFRDDAKQYGFSSELNWDVADGHRLTWIGSYRKFQFNGRTEVDFTNLDSIATSTGGSFSAPGARTTGSRTKTFTQELRLAGSVMNDKFDYLVGAFYSDERIRENTGQSLGPDFQAYVGATLLSLGMPGPNPLRDIFAGGVDANGSYADNAYRQNYRNLSIFTNNTFHISDAVRFNFGIRYSDDKKTGAFRQISANSPACSAVIANQANLTAAQARLFPIARVLSCFPFTTKFDTYVGGPTGYSSKIKNGELSYTAKLMYEAAPDVNTYASYSRGYKAGGFNSDATAASANPATGVAGDPRFGAETVDAYELGVKSKLLDRKLTVNLALFYEDFKGYQNQEFTGTQFVVYNVPKLRSKGFELDIIARPTRELTFNFGVAYADATFPSKCAGSITAEAILNLCGQALPGAPKWTVAPGVMYQTDISDALEFTFNANARMVSDRRTAAQALQGTFPGTGTINGPAGALSLIPTPLDIQDGHTKLNLRVAIGAPSGKWKLELWGNNVFNIQTISSSTNAPLRGSGRLPGALNAGAASVSRIAWLEEPRTYGVTVRTQF